MGLFNKRMVDVTIRIPMEFPVEWDDEECEYFLNEGGWCWTDLLADLDRISNHGQKCICPMCFGEIAKEDGMNDDEIMEMSAKADTGRYLN